MSACWNFIQTLDSQNCISVIYCDTSNNGSTQLLLPLNVKEIK